MNETFAIRRTLSRARKCGVGGFVEQRMGAIRLPFLAVWCDLAFCSSHSTSCSTPLAVVTGVGTAVPAK
jgi:hypothetical protein